MHLITTHNQVVCNVMAGLTKTFLSPDIILQNLEAITACSSWTKACMEKLLHTNTYTHTHAFTHRNFYTQTLLHTEAFLHTNTFTQKHFYTQTLLHTDGSQSLLHTDAFTHRSFYTQAGPCSRSHSEVIVLVATSALRRRGEVRTMYSVDIHSL